MSFPSESEKMSKELQNSDLIYVNLITDIFKIIVKYHQKIIVKYRHLSPSGNRVLDSIVEICHCFGVFSIIFRNSRLEVLLRKDVRKVCNKFTGEHPCRSLISIKLLCRFIEIASLPGCSPVNLQYIFKTSFVSYIVGFSNFLLSDRNWNSLVV